MPQSPREVVKRCLTFDRPERLPRELWALPFAEKHYPEALGEIRRRFPGDFTAPANIYRPSSVRQGDAYVVGTYIDEWGCVFENIHDGVHGQVKHPVLSDITNWRSVTPPYETLPSDERAAIDEVNRQCALTDKFVRASACPRPWERLQFIRGTSESMMDLVEPENGVLDLLRVIHEFHMKELELWVRTDVDGISFMDDWGTQRSLLISPATWREYFKPLYKDYCDIAHAHGKFAFMHSDGHIEAIYPDLVEIGVDALNSQLFCMDMAKLASIAKGKLTFWGEIDRQHVLPSPDPEVGRQAVREVARHFYDPAGGVMAQFEISPGSNPDVAIAIFEEWEKVGSGL